VKFLFRLRLGAATVRVEEERDLKDQNNEVHGYSEELKDVSRDDWLIRLESQLHPRAKALTLLHEMLHVIDDSNGLGLGESKIRKLEQALGQAFRDNPIHLGQMVRDLARE
jgi:hypothetical protein